MGKKIGQCKTCNEDFVMKHKNHKFCSYECKNKDKKNDKALANCSNCNKEVMKSKSQIRKYENLFCCRECETEFRRKSTHEMRKCEICDSKFEVSKKNNQRFCSIQCQGKWQSEYLVGENGNGYKKNYSTEDRTLTCELCNNKYQVNPYQIDKSRFCSDKCRVDWHSNVWSQTEEWKEESRIRAVEILENGLVSKTQTGCQIDVNSMLDELGIEYKNEKGFKLYSVDNYLVNHNLIIEVMGTYWHTDHRVYKEIKYEHQVKRIKIDKAKHTYIKNNYNIEILYLWEYDITNNSDLCMYLIKEYVKNKGVINNYHSFNYILNNNKVELKNIIEIPYMEKDKNEVSKSINLSTKEKVSKKQVDKWIAFNCDFCGCETEQLISRYKLRKRHYCSDKCRNEGLKKPNLKEVV